MVIIKKIKVYYGKTNAYNAEIIENVTDKKVIVFDTTKTLEELQEYYKQNLNNLNSFYDMVNSKKDIFDNVVLDEFDLIKIAEYEE